MPRRALCHHCLHKCLSMFSKSVQLVEQLWRRPMRHLTVLQPGEVKVPWFFLSVWSNFLSTAATMQPSAVKSCCNGKMHPRLGHSSWDKIKIYIFPQFHFKTIIILQWKKKKSFIEEFWTSTSQFSICKINCVPVLKWAFVHGRQMYQRREKQSSHKNCWNTLAYVSWKLGTKYFVCEWKKKNEVKVPYNE